ncbi:MAG: hypothetical protein ABSC94_07910 [Polyangiaceae bacterium]|jgi:hypothetical protein
MNDSRGDWRGLRLLRPLVAALVATALYVSGCAGDEGQPQAKAPETGRSGSLAHEPCGGSGGSVESQDTNGDGKPDIRRYFDRGGQERCRVVDLNHDGRPDLYEYFDAAGAVRRREFCYDDTGLVNAVEYYEAGKLVRREYDISGQHRVDTWDWFDPNAPVDPTTGRPRHPTRRERDTKGSGYIDQWWTWNGDTLSIAVDKNGDGKPDPETAILLGGDAGTSAPAASASPADGGFAGTIQNGGAEAGGSSIMTTGDGGR